MRMDLIPAGVSGVATTVAGMANVIPGPSQDEWTVVILPLVALVIREVIWWIRNRKK